MLKIGNNDIGKVYLGSNKIGKAYLGSDLVYESGSTPAPVFHTRLIFDGTAYIDTDILFPEDGSIRIYLGYETEKKSQVLFNAGGRVYATLNSNTNTTSRAFSFAYDSSTALISGTTRTLAWTTNVYSLFLTPKRGGIGNNSTTFTKGSSRPTTGIVLGQNAAHSNTPFTGAMAYVRIYGSDAQNATSYSDLGNYTPLYTLRPCTYLGEPGMWCEETSTFYGNSAGARQLSVAD